MSEETKPKYRVGEDIYTILDYPVAASRAARDMNALVSVNYGVVKARIMSVVSSETVSMKDDSNIIKTTNYVVIPTDKKGNPIPNNQNPQEPLMMKLGAEDLFPTANEAKLAFLKVIDTATENYKTRVNASAIDAASATIELTDK